jgi:UDP-GlcNAc:undecaprenyl-phosphate GlcNAc-1-phosphate transferase
VLDGLPLLATAALSAVIAAGLALYLAPVLIRAALRYGIVDRPSSALKTQQDPVPYLGGMVVFVGFLLALAVVFPFDRPVLAILLSASLVVSVGLIDDLGTLTPRDKLVGQLIAAAVLVKAGVQIDIEVLPQSADVGLSVFWLLACMNAFNILDVSDGLATSAGVVGAGGALVVAALNAEPTVAAIAGALLGACLGFLWFNREPARMYLGDTGSMFIGLVLGALAMIGRYSEVNSVSAFFVPLALVAAPLFDTMLVVVARLRAGRRIWYGSTDHFAVRLKHAGWSARRVAWSSALLGAVVAGGSVGTTVLGDGPALITSAGVIATGVALVVVVMLRYPAPPLPEDVPTTAVPDGGENARAPS